MLPAPDPAQPAAPGRHRGGRPRSAEVATTAGVCPLHGSVEFREHRIGFDRLGNQRFRFRCPQCHADDVYAARVGPVAPARTVVATDGSHTRIEAGFGYVIDEYRYGYGALVPGTHTELVAVRRALAAIAGPVTIVLDALEVYERLALGIAPRQHNAHRGAFLDTMELVASRDVTFVLRGNDTGPPIHALAHYLAFLGRKGYVPDRGRPAPDAQAILTAPDPYAEAGLLVRRHLFPTAASSQAGHVTP